MPQHFRVYDGAYPHFVTCTVTHWIPVFCREDYFGILADSLRYCCENKGLVVHGCVLMPNHFHMICSRQDGDISGIMRDIKRFTSIEIARKLETDGRMSWLTAMRNAGKADGSVRVWTEAFHPEEVRTQPFFEQKLRYMHENPVRAGYVVDPCEWRYSSVGVYYRDAQFVVPITPIDW